MIPYLDGKALRTLTPAGMRPAWLAAFLYCAAALGCNQRPPEATPEASSGEHPCGAATEPPSEPPPITYVAESRESWCGEAQTRLGHRVCVHELTDVETWSQVGLEAAAVDQVRATTYLVPARADARLPTIFVDASAFAAPEQSLHFKFLTGSVPELELLQYAEYLDLVLDSSLREWFGGSVTEFIVPGGINVFGVTVADSGLDPATTITCEQFRTVYDVVGRRIALGPVAIVPSHDVQRETLASCDVPVHDPATALPYEAYTQGKRCGRLRRYTPKELAAAELRAEFGWQDILVTCGAPLDVQTVIAGIVTGTRQGELSHLNVRSGARGTPNCYLQGAYDVFAKWEGQLVELNCGPAGASIVPVTQDGAGWFYEDGQPSLCNEGFKPAPVEIVPADLAFTELVPLLAVPTGTVDERRAALGRFGSKGANLATLYQRIDPALQHKGFLIPVHYYDAFVRNNNLTVDLGAGPELLSFAEVIERYLNDPVFLSDALVRRQLLLKLQAAMQIPPCEPALMAAIEAQLRATYEGRDDVMVRFRSSSNAEDAFRFNGAGLYNSKSACLADEIDADTLGPSRCEPDQFERGEQGVCEALKQVWASLWNMKAFEERSWYGIDHRQVAMGILVNTRTKGELANIVAFTGNPRLRGDPRYLINAQLGELKVVSAEPGVWPENALLTVESGAVVAVERGRHSTELPDGWVLDDARLQELGRQLATIVGVYPIDADLPVFARVYLDTEWKVRPDGTLVVKQVRPFLEE